MQALVPAFNFRNYRTNGNATRTVIITISTLGPSGPTLAKLLRIFLSSGDLTSKPCFSKKKLKKQKR
jgi:hypothetical protein